MSRTTSGTRRGICRPRPGKTVSYEYVAHHLRGLFQRYNIQKIGFDRWNMKAPAALAFARRLPRARCRGAFRRIWTGHGEYVAGLRDLEQVLLEGELAHGGHPVLTCASPIP